MKDISYHFNRGSLVLFDVKKGMLLGKLDKEDFRYVKVKNALIKNESDDVIRKLLESETITTKLKNLVKKCGLVVKNGVVTVNDREAPKVVAERLLSYQKEGLPTTSLENFIVNVMDNISFNSRNEAFSFVEKHNLPLTTDGCFLGYKGVRRDFYDKWTGKILNTVGSVVKKDRVDVDDDIRQACSYGLHVGSYEYATSYAGSDGVVVVVKVNPRDVVSVNNDANCGKIRVCEYTVMEVLEGDKLDRLVYKNDLQPSYGVWDNYDAEQWELVEVEVDEDECCDNDKCCNKTRNYHNVRDANGRFTSKKCKN